MPGGFKIMVDPVVAEDGFTWQSHSNNYVPGLRGKKGKKKRSKSFTQKMINEWEKSQKSTYRKGYGQ